MNFSLNVVRIPKCGLKHLALFAVSSFISILSAELSAQPHWTLFEAGSYLFGVKDEDGFVINFVEMDSLTKGLPLRRSTDGKLVVWLDTESSIGQAVIRLELADDGALESSRLFATDDSFVEFPDGTTTELTEIDSFSSASPDGDAIGFVGRPRGRTDRIAVIATLDPESDTVRLATGCSLEQGESGFGASGVFVGAGVGGCVRTINAGGGPVREVRTFNADSDGFAFEQVVMASGQSWPSNGGSACQLGNFQLLAHNPQDELMPLLGRGSCEGIVLVNAATNQVSTVASEFLYQGDDWKVATFFTITPTVAVEGAELTIAAEWEQDVEDPQDRDKENFRGVARCVLNPSSLEISTCGLSPYVAPGATPVEVYTLFINPQGLAMLDGDIGSGLTAFEVDPNAAVVPGAPVVASPTSLLAAPGEPLQSGRFYADLTWHNASSPIGDLVTNLIDVTVADSEGNPFFTVPGRSMAIRPSSNPPNHPPDVAFALDCDGLTCQTQNNTSDEDAAQSLTYVWERLAEGGAAIFVSNEFEPEIAFPAEGSYAVRLRATDSDGAQGIGGWVDIDIVDTVGNGGSDTGRIEGTVWLDNNRDGVQAPEETGVFESVLVRLTGPDGEQFAVTEVVSGTYVFRDLLPGTYTVTPTLGRDEATLFGGPQYFELVSAALDIDRTPRVTTVPASGTRTVEIAVSGGTVSGIDFSQAVDVDSLESTQAANTVSTSRELQIGRVIIGSIDSNDPGDFYKLPGCDVSEHALYYVEVADLDGDGEVKGAELLDVRGFSNAMEPVPPEEETTTDVGSARFGFNACDVDIIQVAPLLGSTNFYAIHAGNQPPVISNKGKQYSRYVGERLFDIYEAEDETPEELIWSSDNLPEGCEWLEQQGALAYFDCAALPFIPEDQPIVVKVTDPDGLSDTAQVVLRMAEAPGIAAILERNVVAGDTLTFDVETSGGIGDTSLTLGERAPDFCSIDGNTVTCNPEEGDAGRFNISLIYVDARGTEVIQNVTLTVTGRSGSGPLLSAYTSWVDQEGDGKVSPGDTFQIQVLIRNDGDAVATNVTYRQNLPRGEYQAFYFEPLDPPAPTASPQGDVEFSEIGDMPVVLGALGDLAPRQEVTLFFSVRLEASALGEFRTSGELEIGGWARADNDQFAFTSDLLDIGESTLLLIENTPTRVNEPLVRAFMDVIPNEAVSPGDDLWFRVRIRNDGDAVANDVRYEHSFDVPTGAKFHLEPLAVQGFPSTSRGVLDFRRNIEGVNNDWGIEASIGTLGPEFEEVTLLYFVRVVATELGAYPETGTLNETGLVLGSNISDTETRNPDNIEKTGVEIPVVTKNAPPEFIQGGESDVELLVSSTQTIEFLVVDEDRSALEITASGLPEWCGFEDLGYGNATIDCSTLSYPTYKAVQVTAIDRHGLAASRVFLIRSIYPVRLKDDGGGTGLEGGLIEVELRAEQGKGPFTFSLYSNQATDFPEWCELQDNGDGTATLTCNPPAGSAGEYPVDILVEDSDPDVAASDRQKIVIRVLDPAAPPKARLVIERRYFNLDTGQYLDNEPAVFNRGDTVRFEYVIRNVGNARAEEIGPINDVYSLPGGGARANDDLILNFDIPPDNWKCNFPNNGNVFMTCFETEGRAYLDPGETLEFQVLYDVAEELRYLEQNQICDIAVVYWERGEKYAATDRGCLDIALPDASFLKVFKTQLDEDNLATWKEIIPSLADRDDFEFPATPDDGYQPGDQVYWVVNVQNWGTDTARDVRELNDESTVLTRFRQVESNLANFEPLFVWPGWGCSFVGGQLVRCQPESGTFDMPPRARMLFVFKFDIVEELPRPDLDELCNEARVYWEGNRVAQNEQESCFIVNSPGVPTLEVVKQVLDPQTIAPIGSFQGEFWPGDLVEFKVTVTNSGDAPATGISSLEDYSVTRNADTGKVFDSFSNLEVLSEPVGWSCAYLTNAGRLLCDNESGPETLESEESMEFVFRARIADPIQGKNVRQICNTAAVLWNDGPTFGRACFPVDQQAAADGLPNPVAAPTLEQANRLLDYGEQQLPDLLRPPAETQEASLPTSSWFYRYYPETEIYLAISVDGIADFLAGDVYALGGPFGSQVLLIDSLANLLEFIDSEQ